MADRVLSNEKIEVLWNSVLDEVLGDGKSVLLALEDYADYSLQVTGIRIKDTVTGATREIEVKGIFLAIGHIPNTDPFVGKVDTDKEGSVLM